MNRMKQLREELGLNMREAAKALRFPYTTYVNYEKGSREPNSEALIAIASFYNTSIDYLLGRSVSRNCVVDKKPTPKGTEDGRNIVRIASRDGSYKEMKLTDEQYAALAAMIDQLPEAD